MSATAEQPNIETISQTNEQQEFTKQQIENVQNVPAQQPVYQSTVVPTTQVQYAGGLPTTTTNQYVTNNVSYGNVVKTQQYPQYAQSIGTGYATTTNTCSAVQACAKQTIKGESRVEYYPIERKEIEYQTVEKTIQEQVPVQKIEYVTVEKKVTEQVPTERVVTEYQAVEYQKEYVPRIEYDTVQEQVPVQKLEYVPVQKVEYVPQQKTEYVTQSRQVERIEYDEVEYQVQRPQVTTAPHTTTHGAIGQATFGVPTQQTASFATNNIVPATYANNAVVNKPFVTNNVVPTSYTNNLVPTSYTTTTNNVVPTQYVNNIAKAPTYKRGPIATNGYTKTTGYPVTTTNGYSNPTLKPITQNVGQPYIKSPVTTLNNTQNQQYYNKRLNNADEKGLLEKIFD